MKTLEEFFRLYPQQSYQTKKLLLEPGKKIDTVFLIEEGIIRQYHLSKEGNETTLATHTHGAVIPLMQILAKEINAFFFEAATNVTVRKAPVSDTIDFLQKNPEALFVLTKRFARALFSYVARFEEKLHTDVKMQLLSLLVYLDKRFGNQLNFTHHDLATFLGVSRETITRALKQLQKEKRILIKEKKYFILEHQSD